ncbi:MAG: hypothetical protein QY304_00065 [Candidatus Paceibacterota bacterium]|nr:MAG: hypothetical protein QY304_00065 [Candidatus Paceibacterota bacterium]
MPPENQFQNQNQEVNSPKKKSPLIWAVVLILILLVAGTVAGYFALNKTDYKNYEISIISPDSNEIWEIGKKYKVEWSITPDLLSSQPGLFMHIDLKNTDTGDAVKIYNGAIPETENLTFLLEKEMSESGYGGGIFVGPTKSIGITNGTYRVNLEIYKKVSCKNHCVDVAFDVETLAVASSEIFLIKSEGSVSAWEKIVAKLDKTALRSGCSPFYPVDLYAVANDGIETLIYKGMKVCNPGGITEDEFGTVNKLFSFDPFIVDGQRLGEVVRMGSGDAGSGWSRSVYFPYSNPTQYFEIITSFYQQNSSFTTKYLGKENKVTVKPADLTLGSCESHEIAIYMNDVKVWEINENYKKSICENYYVETGGVQKARINYKYLFSNIRPTSQDFHVIEFSWGSLHFRFNLIDPINTFVLSGKG